MLCTAYSTVLCLPGPIPAPYLWRFDLVSALIGAGIALLLVALAYRFRTALRQGWQDLIAPVVKVQHRLRASAEDRYRELVTALAHSLVLLAPLASLEDVFIEPQLILPPPTPEPLSEAQPAPAGPQVLPLRRIFGQHHQLAILGAPGTGKTTLLADVALLCTRLAEDTGEDASTETTLDPLRGRLPLYVPLPALDWDEQDETEETGKPEGAGVERLLAAAVAAVGGGGRLAGPLRQRLEAGQAVVLVDGWEELSSQGRQAAGTWLADLADALPGNLWLSSAGPRGYAPLVEAGFVPLRLAAWDGGQMETFAWRWVKSRTSTDEPPPIPLNELVAELHEAAHVGAPPLELALRALVILQDGQAPTGRAPLFDRALDILLWQEEQPWLSEVCREVLEQVTWSLQQEGRATASRDEIEAAVESALPPAEERPARATSYAFRTLTGARSLLRSVGTDRYAPTHPLWQAYLAARQLATADPASLAQWLDDPRWTEVLRFYAELGNMGPLVAAWLRSPDDMFHIRLHRLSSWVSVAPADAAWRDGAMATLARTFLQDDHPGQVRQALAHTLVATGVPGITYFFRQAIKHSDPEVRVAAVLGLTRIASEADLPALKIALEDESAAVCEAAVRGLAYVSTDAATEWLGQILWIGDETLGPLAAEALAQRGATGVALLREAVESDDVMARRAAVFGLAQVNARDLLRRVAREDDQWIVRSAATAALDELQEQESICGVAPPAEIDRLPWLISWAAAQGEGVGLGAAARRTLRHALREGDVSTRLAAAQMLAQVGQPDDVETLRAALSDTDPDVTSAALDALAEIDRRYDLRIE